ncbi:hypothetical protein B0J11DRAFT_512815 [Dendryphion nanum]|uniref:Rhodopsin domain-containing protein n=1 Tax=Dendryphion nanum TaxID=256645 RepID=A0A9P9CZG2_9PLEO|nr:hypothetical protein B0J11DRAFT_512815 [Dendryphion nanum]
MDSFPVPLELIIVASFCLLLLISAICVRAYAQSTTSRRQYARDIVMSLAGAGVISFIGILLFTSRLGLGHPVENVSIQSLKRVRFFLNILDMLYPPTIVLAKAALLLEIETIAGPGSQRKFIRWCVWLLIVVNGLAYTALLFVNIVACNPRSKILDPSVPGKCIDQNVLRIATCAFSLISDLTLFALPMCLVSRFQLSVKRGLAVSGIFVIGFIACGCAAARVYHTIKLTRHNFTLVMERISIWSTTEITCIIVVACLPSLPLLLASFRQRRMRRSSYPHIHREWTSHPGTRCSTPGASSKSELFHPTRPSPTATQESLPHISLPSTSNEVTQSAPANPLSSNPPTPPLPPFEPLERPISHLSYESYQTAAIAEILDHVSPHSMPPTPISPVSGISRLSALAQTGEAVEVTMAQVGAGDTVVDGGGVMRFSSVIRKTVDVRVSNHTNPGSPVRWARAEDSW